MRIKRKEQKGITLISLVVTIVILLILASVGTYSGIQAIEFARLNKFTAEMKIMQTQVNDFYDKYKNNGTIGDCTGEEILNLGKDLIYSSQTNTVFTSEASGITETLGYRYFDKETIENLKIEGVTEEFFVNIEKRSIISCTGLKYNDKTYYTLEQLPNNLYNVEYKQEAHTPEFNIKQDLIGEKKYKITIEPNYSGSIEKWEVKYQKEGKTNWETSDNLQFNIDEPGNYNIKIQNGDIQSVEKTQYLGYTTEGLVVHYDGIANTRNGNNPSATLWEDLSGEKNDGKVHGSIWNEKYIQLDGVDDYLETSSVVNYNSSKEITIELLDIEGSFYENNNGGSIILESSENWNTSPTGFGINSNEWGEKDLSITFHHIDGYNINTTNNNILDSGKTNLYAITINTTKPYNNFINMYKNGEALVLNTNASHNYDISNTQILNYIIYIGSGAGSNNYSKMRLGALRIYNRELSQGEIQQNYQLDKERFRIEQ